MDSGNQVRVAGLRREEIAMLAGISVEYYTRLERGNASGVSEDVLDGNARALQLDEAERAHLFDLVRSANRARPPAAAPARSGSGRQSSASWTPWSQSRPTSVTAVWTANPPGRGRSEPARE